MSDDPAFRSAENSEDIEKQSHSSLSHPIREPLHMERGEKLDEDQSAEKKQSKLELTISVFFFTFLLVIWPIIEYIYFAKFDELCLQEMPGTFDVAKWMLADAILLSIPVALIITCFCFLCCSFCIDLCCKCDNLEAFGQVCKELQKQWWYNAAILTMTFIITATMGAIGVSSCIWAMKNCASPVPGIVITTTILRLGGVLLVLWNFVKFTRQ